MAIGAPLGNKNAVGHGRPPNPGYSDEEIIQIGKDMLEWIKTVDSSKTKQRIVHLSQFYSELKGIPKTQWNHIVERFCFRCYYDQAKDWIGKKIMLDAQLPTAYGSRFLGIYFKEVTDHEEEVFKKKIDYEYDKKTACDYRNQQTQETLDTAKEILIAKLAYENEQMRKQLEELKNAQPKTDSIIQ